MFRRFGYHHRHLEWNRRLVSTDAWKRLRRDIRRHNQAVLTTYPRTFTGDAGLVQLFAGILADIMHQHFTAGVFMSIGAFLVAVEGWKDKAPAPIREWRETYKVPRHRLVRVPGKQIPAHLHDYRFEYYKLAKDVLHQGSILR